jgi:hypothetical protein
MMLHQSNRSRGQKMEEMVDGLLCLASMLLATTNGMLRSKDRNSCCMQESGKGRATSPSRGLLLSIATPASPCKQLLNCNPLQKKRVDHAGGKRSSADVSDATGKDACVSFFGTKKGTGSSGVPL